MELTDFESPLRPEVEEGIRSFADGHPRVIAKLLYPELLALKDSEIKKEVDQKSAQEMHTKAFKLATEKIDSQDLTDLVDIYKLSKNFLGEDSAKIAAHNAFVKAKEKISDTEDNNKKFGYIKKIFEVDLSDAEEDLVENWDIVKDWLEVAFRNLSTVQKLRYQELYGAIKDFTKNQGNLPKVYKIYSFMNPYVRQVVQKMDLPYRYADPAKIHRDINEATRYFDLGFMENQPKRDDDLWKVVQNAKLRVASY